MDRQTTSHATRFEEHNGSAAATCHTVVSRHEPEKALLPLDRGAQFTRASAEFVFWGVLGMGLCLLGALIFWLSGFWREVLIAMLVGLNGGQVLQGLLRSGLTASPGKSDPPVSAAPYQGG